MAAATAAPHPALALTEAIQLVPGANNPNPPVNWRWERARWLLAQQRRPRKGSDDNWVEIALRFQRDLDKVQKVSAVEQLASRTPGVYWAWFWHSQSNRLVRWTVEAYLCAGATYREVSHRSGLSLDAVCAYEKLFFNVRGQLQCVSYMLNQVMGKSIHQGLSDRDYDLLWKLYGWLRGPILLDAILRTDTNPGALTTYGQIQDASAELMRSALGTKALFSARTMSISGNEQTILEAYNKMVEIEKNATGGGAGSTLIIQNLQAVLNAVQFRIGAPAQQYLPTGSSAELRAEELYAIAEGAELPGLDEVATLSFPAKSPSVNGLPGPKI